MCVIPLRTMSFDVQTNTTVSHWNESAISRHNDTNKQKKKGRLSPFLVQKQLPFLELFRNKNTFGGLLHIKDVNLSEESKQLFRYQCRENTFVHEDADNILLIGLSENKTKYKNNEHRSGKHHVLLKQK